MLRFMCAGLFRAQLIHVVVYTTLIIVGIIKDIRVVLTKFHTQSMQFSNCVRSSHA